MSNVVVDRSKIDILANAISCKSGEPVPMTLTEMIDAVDGIEDCVECDNCFIITITYDEDEEIFVPDRTFAEVKDAYDNGLTIAVGTPYDPYDIAVDGIYTDDDGDCWYRYTVYYAGEADAYWAWDYVLNENGLSYEDPFILNPPNLQTITKTYTPTESQQTETITYDSNDYNGLEEVNVTVNAIPSNYVGSGITQRTSSDLTVSDATVTAPAGYYASNATKTVASGTEGTPTATKGTVNNHSISITPSVTNSAGYISGSTKTGTAVSVSASELVSGSQTINDNGDYNVTNLASVTVNVSGGSSALTVGTKTTTLSSSSSSISFSSLSGNPTSFVITSSADLSTGATKAVAVAYDGTSFHGMDITTQMENDIGFTKSYSNGTLTVTATSATFEANEYKLVYTYGGSSSDIHTADVQVGSGATSITFSSLSGKPAYFSCVFKSTFSTSSGYQRVIDVVNDGTNTYGNAMDSSAKAQTSWSYSYSGGTLTITSTGTNSGGYFHQPGYYQLTYAVDPNALNLQTKTGIGANTSSQTITADNGYDGLESVQINPVSQTNLVAGNIKSGTTVSISNGTTNLWSVTGTYSGGGGSKNVQTHQSTSRTTSTSLSSVNSLTCTVAGTYDVYWTCTRSSTSGTWSSRLYVNGSASGDEQTTWSNHVQTVYLTGVTIGANQTVAVYAKSRGTNYYAYAPQLTIVQTS